MAPLAIGTVIQTPTIPCTQRAQESRLYLLQEQENMTSGAKLTLIGRISGPHLQIEAFVDISTLATIFSADRFYAPR